MEGIVSLLPLLFIAAVFYFLLIRPQRNRQRVAQQMQNQIQPGQRIMTTGGLYATVVAVDDDGIELEIAPGVTSRWSRGSIARVLIDETLDLEGDVNDPDVNDPDVNDPDDADPNDAAGSSDAGIARDSEPDAASKSTSGAASKSTSGAASNSTAEPAANPAKESEGS